MKSLFPLLTILLVSTASLSAQSNQRPNVLFIVADDLRASLGCYGHQEVKTPNLDALAQRGVRFEHAYNQYSVCGPSRASFMTGLRPEQTRIWGNVEHFRDKLPNIVTLPQSFREAGYYTASYGKVFHVGRSAHSESTWMDTEKSWSHTEYIPNLTPDMPQENYFRGLKTEPELWGPTVGDEENQPDAKIATRAIAAMKKADGKPWFIAAGFHRPHSPYVCPQKYFDLYSPEKLTIYQDPKNITSAPPLALPWTKQSDAHYKSFTEQDKRNHLWSYYACISFMDAQVGRLLDELKATGLDKNTIVVFTGDNGYHLGERDWWNKVTLFERSCRIPFIMAGPGIAQNQPSHALVELIDIYPTLNHLCAVDGPKDLPGESFKAVLENPASPGKGYAFTMVARDNGKTVGRSVRSGRWRYTEWDNGRQGIELYDEQTDPEETKDQSRNPEYKEVITSMKALFDKLPKID
jgi:choline-sulfatase